MKRFIMILTATAINGLLSAQTILPLYDAVPNSKPSNLQEKSETDANGRTRIANVTTPTLTVYLPPKEKATGAAVVICPGGGYARLAYTHEGTDVAKRFTEMGIAAFLLKYRLPNDAIMINKEIGPVQDAQRAIQMVRANAREWGVDPKKVGIMGFSAGGHLAATAGTHFQYRYITAKKSENLRPDFMILIYPVISFVDSMGHSGSRTNLVGANPSPEKIAEYSNDQHVTSKTPPTFLVHAEDDASVKVSNSLHFYEQLKKYHVQTRIFLYQKGGHGFGMNNPTSEVQYMPMIEEWLKKQQFLK